MWCIKNLQKINFTHIILLICFLLLVLPYGIRAETTDSAQLRNSASQNQRDQEFEAKVEGKLKSISEQAVPAFQRATAAYDSARYEDAKKGFLKVLQLAPDFPDALRRLGHVLAALGDSVEAEVKLRRALEVNRTKENLAALAGFLMNLHDSQKQREAGGLVKEAMSIDPTDFHVLIIAVQGGFILNDVALWRPAINHLMSIAPNEMSTHYFSAIAALYDRNWNQAEQEVLLAKGLGLPANETNRLLDVIDHNRPKTLPKNLNDQIEKVLNRPMSTYDSHPPIKERINYEKIYSTVCFNLILVVCH